MEWQIAKGSPGLLDTVSALSLQQPAEPTLADPRTPLAITGEWSEHDTLAHAWLGRDECSMCEI